MRNEREGKYDIDGFVLFSSYSPKKNTRHSTSLNRNRNRNRNR